MEKPGKHELWDAVDVCFNLAKYIKETEPHAVHDISVLEKAADILDTFTNDDLEEGENGESPTTEN